MTVKIMLNGLPGNMASEVVKAIAENSDFELIPHSLTGPEIDDKSFDISNISFKLIKPGKRDEIIADIKQDHFPFISIDFSHPSAVNSNASFYCDNKLPFVMGTTGGDRDILTKTVEQSGIPAVIAPNMAKQIVGLQMMLEYASENFPGLFSGYSMTLEESHQSTKADTSGTAKAFVSYFNKMGIPFTLENIKKVRDPEIQKNEWNIPEEFLKGHAYHTYTLTSADKSVTFQIKHNVLGRNIYALGTLDAAAFLQAKIDKDDNRLFTMLDVLKTGKMQ